jgi:uncharacterized protein
LTSGVPSPPSADVPTPLRAVGGWLAAWVAGNLLAGTVMGTLTDAPSAAEAPVWAFAIAALCLWIPLVGTAAVMTSGGDLRSLPVRCASVRWFDLLGVPAGLATQLVLVPALYLPLRGMWPATFSEEALQENARALIDGAEGVWLVVLFVVVALMAPLAEEIVYRGLLHRSLVSATGAGIGTVAAALLFMVIHFRPVEYPGLFVTGLVFGLLYQRTGRLATAVMAHMAFNAAGLVFAL